MPPFGPSRTFSYFSRRLREGPKSGHHADAFGPTCSVSIIQPPNPRPLVVVSVHWSLRYALHHGETRRCISLPFHISFIAIFARKRPELNRYKTTCGASAISLVACAVSPCCSTTPQDQLGDLFQNRLMSSRLDSISSY
jgi:hypothetical protein